jgi:hypothetical protein
MEKRLNKKLEQYILTFKTNIRDKAVEMGLTNSNEVNQLIQYIYDYDRLTFETIDFQKRKRVKNFVPMFDRCCAKRATNERCTRRKKEGCEYCGTHMKGTPHGIVDDNLNDNAPMTTQKIQVWAQDIQGIIQYIDNFGNVYQPEDILTNKINPKIIAKYTKNEDNYSVHF